MVLVIPPVKSGIAEPLYLKRALFKLVVKVSPFSLILEFDATKLAARYSAFPVAGSTPYHSLNQ